MCIMLRNDDITGQGPVGNTAALMGAVLQLIRDQEEAQELPAPVEPSVTEPALPPAIESLGNEAPSTLIPTVPDSDENRHSELAMNPYEEEPEYFEYYYRTEIGPQGDPNGTYLYNTSGDSEPLYIMATGTDDAAHLLPMSFLDDATNVPGRYRAVTPEDFQSLNIGSPPYYDYSAPLGLGSPPPNYGAAMAESHPSPFGNGAFRHESDYMRQLEGADAAGPSGQAQPPRRYSTTLNPNTASFYPRSYFSGPGPANHESGAPLGSPAQGFYGPPPQMSPVPTYYQQWASGPFGPPHIQPQPGYNLPPPQFMMVQPPPSPMVPATGYAFRPTPSPVPVRYRTGTFRQPAPVPMRVMASPRPPLFQSPPALPAPPRGLYPLQSAPGPYPPPPMSAGQFFLLPMAPQPAFHPQGAMVFQPPMPAYAPSPQYQMQPLLPFPPVQNMPVFDQTYFAPPGPSAEVLTPGRYDYSTRNRQQRSGTCSKKPSPTNSTSPTKPETSPPKKLKTDESGSSGSAPEHSSTSPRSRNWGSDTEEESEEEELVEEVEEEESGDSDGTGKTDDEEEDGKGGCGGSVDASEPDVNNNTEPDKTQQTKSQSEHNGSGDTSRRQLRRGRQHQPAMRMSEKAIQWSSRGQVCDMIVAEMEDYKYSYYLRGVEFPYVSSVWDVRVDLSIKDPALNFDYYVPPRVESDDFFGGQKRIWQERMVHIFSYYYPDIWKLQALPDFEKPREDGWYHFTVTSKLRFCCRNCIRPWTSMRGKIHFAFKLESAIREGFIFMKIFGQVCIQENCLDRDFQTPACYPEEIDRVLWKLSQYIGFAHYQMPLASEFYCEPDKAVRLGNPKSPHRKELCQACHQGICARA